MFGSSPFSDLPELRTARLRLRKLNMGDAQDVFAYSRDPEVARHVLWSAQNSVSEARGYIRQMLKQYRTDQPSSWGIEYMPDRRLVGTIGYMWHNADHASVEVGYSLSREYWNGGVMTEALREVLQYTFIKNGVHRVEAQHETDNPASGKVMLKCGMRYEGTLRGRLYNKGRYVDVDLYAILREDYLGRVNV